jgi:hypothetical protein
MWGFIIGLLIVIGMVVLADGWLVAHVPPLAWIFSHVPYSRWIFWGVIAVACLWALFAIVAAQEKDREAKAAEEKRVKAEEERTARAKRMAAALEEENRTVARAMDMTGRYSPEHEAALRRQYTADRATYWEWGDGTKGEAGEDDRPDWDHDNEMRQWECDPDDEDAYIAFVESVLQRASVPDAEEPEARPFQVGLRDGLDVRATERRGHQNFTNGAIDWINVSEHSDLLSGYVENAGWIDPSFTRIGSASRTLECEVLQKDPWVQRNHRKFTLISLDAPNSGPVFYNRVILPLVNLKGSSKDHLYEWLEIMFHFCAGKPFAYYSVYVPSPQIHRIAWKHKVQIVHFPLNHLPSTLLNRNGSFRFLSLTRRQWKEFDRRRSARTATWSGPQ